MRILSFIFLIYVSCACSNKAQLVRTSKGDDQQYPKKTSYTSDLVLLYQGGTHRLDYTEDELIPYVFKENNGHKDWLFDGFLFIEFKDNLGNEFAKGYHQKPANKEQWKWLLGRNFEQGKGVSALNSLLRKSVKEGNTPKRMRKVVLTLPDPIIGFEQWGELNGKSLNFNQVEDRIAACKWFIDYTIDQWDKQGFEQLDFDGFYWVAETQSTTKEVLPEIASYIKSKGLKFHWIPYMYAEGAEKWKEAGFDIAYQQPNYFFGLDKPKSLFTKAIYNSDNYAMGLEMEFDGNMIQNPAYRQRYYDYIAAFEEGNVWNSKPVAYYEGGGAWLKLFKSEKDSQARKDYDVLADIIIKRQQKEDAKY